MCAINVSNNKTIQVKDAVIDVLIQVIIRLFPHTVNLTSERKCKKSDLKLNMLHITQKFICLTKILYLTQYLSHNCVWICVRC